MKLEQGFVDCVAQYGNTTQKKFFEDRIGLDYPSPILIKWNDFLKTGTIEELIAKDHMAELTRATFDSFLKGRN